MNPALSLARSPVSLDSTPAGLDEAIARALDVLERTQAPEGSWKGAYGGPLFLMPLYVEVAWIAGISLDERTCAGFERYARREQNADGGWGLHEGGASMVFPTALNYVALRLLGAPADDEALARARSWLHERGGPLYSASWGKFALALLGVYDWEGITPLPPELWLMPSSVPVHPGRLWCHARMVYLPMSWLYARRATAPCCPIVEALRRELYPVRWEDIDWRAHRTTVADEDAYVRRPRWARLVDHALDAVERRTTPAIRRVAMQRVLDLIDHEDESTNYICIGPINKLYNTLVWRLVDPGGLRARRHVERLRDYLWEDASGAVFMNGYNSSELWDTAFAVQAAVAAGALEERRDMLRRAHDFIDHSQVREDVREPARHFREPSAGGWPFSTRAHGWPISDCTAEGIKSALLLERHVPHPIGAARLRQAVGWILSVQNPDGGWPTYERKRGPGWLEHLNPSDCFADIMVDYSWVECTSACIQALVAYRDRYPAAQRPAIDEAIRRGVRFLLRRQRRDGGWQGAWGICFTYATWFAVSGLRAAGLQPDHPALRRACQFLEGVQLADGGWGETIESCKTGQYCSTEQGQAVMTSWALLALIRAGEARSPVVRRGVEFLLRRQLPDGTWPAEHIAGVFNRTCAIHYDNYLKVFPLWALAEARRAGVLADGAAGA